MGKYLDETDQLNAIDDIEVKEVVQDEMLNVQKLIGKLVKDKGTVKDWMRLIIVWGNLKEGVLTEQGNDYVAGIKDVQSLYAFMVGLMPEIMLKLFVNEELSKVIEQRIEASNKITKSWMKNKRNKKNSNGNSENSLEKQLASLISIENRAIIVKFILLLPYMYEELEEKDLIVFDTLILAKLISLINSNKLIVNALTSLMLLNMDQDTIEEILITYLKIRLPDQPDILQYVLTSASSTVLGIADKHEHSKWTKELLKLANKLIPNDVDKIWINFILTTWRMYKNRIHKGKSELSEKIIEVIISQSFIQSCQYMSELIYLARSEPKNNINKAYEIILDLLSRVLHFVGYEITIYMPFMITAVKLYNSILHKYQESLSMINGTSTLSIWTYIMLVLEKNDAYFTKKPKEAESKVNFDNILNLTEVDEDTLEHTKTVGKWLNSLLSSLKVSLALYYNKGKNVAFPEFSLPICARLRSLSKSYKVLEDNIILKNTKMEEKDSRYKIYASRRLKINKLLDAIGITINASFTVRNDYAKSVNADTHQINKMVEYCAGGYANEQPNLYKEAIKAIEE